MIGPGLTVACVSIIEQADEGKLVQLTLRGHTWGQSLGKAHFNRMTSHLQFETKAF